jgi:hypothetical protein
VAEASNNCVDVDSPSLRTPVGKRVTSRKPEGSGGGSAGSPIDLMRAISLEAAVRVASPRSDSEAGSANTSTVGLSEV